MEILEKYHFKNDPDYEVHKVKTSNGRTRYYIIDPFTSPREEPTKIPLRKSTAEWRIENGYIVTYDQLDDRQKRGLEHARRFEEESKKGKHK